MRPVSDLSLSTLLSFRSSTVLDPLRSFLAQFRNCNQWTEAEKLLYLRGSLDKEAGQVLWDYGAESTNSLKQMVKVIKARFGEVNQADRYRI